MKINTIYNEDCIKTMTRFEKVDYIITSPPEFMELELDPKTQSKEYYEFLRRIFVELSHKSDVITIVISDRKHDGLIIPKHSFVMETFNLMGFDLRSYKIWAKSLRINLYRLNYAHCLTFSKGEVKQNQTYEFQRDVLVEKAERFEGFRFPMPVGVVQAHIENYTPISGVVYDPFMGSGTTAVACKNCKRKFIGSEIDKLAYELSIRRLECLTPLIH